MNLFRPALAAALVVLGGPVHAVTDEPVADRVLLRVQSERSVAGRPELRRRADLDRVAANRAARIGALPHSRRLALDESIDTGLSRAGIGGYRRAAIHLDMVRGYADPAAGFLKSWTGYAQAWSKALATEFDSVGIATEVAADGWVVLVAVFLDEIRLPTDLRAVELEAIRRINSIREAHGLSPLSENPALSEVARAHSADMARRAYFSHRAPDAGMAADRVGARGIPFRELAENIQRNSGYDDPARVAVESWMDSKPHRKNILAPGFVETGMGLALDDDGAAFFTQLFLVPRAPQPGSR